VFDEIRRAMHLDASWLPGADALKIVNNQRYSRIALDVFVLEGHKDISASDIEIRAVKIEAHRSDIRLARFRGSCDSCQSLRLQVRNLLIAKHEVNLSFK
jgi:hypothetical protein